MLFKLAVVATLVLIIASLGAGLFSMLRGRSANRRTVRALTVRVGLSVGLFAALMVAYAAGLIAPHGLYPAVP